MAQTINTHKNVAGVFRCPLGSLKRVTGQHAAFPLPPPSGNGGKTARSLTFVEPLTLPNLLLGRQTRLLISLVPYFRSEPDAIKCSKLYELLTNFLSKDGVDLRSVCGALPGLPAPLEASSPPKQAYPCREAGEPSDGFGAFYCDVDGPLLGPASAREREFVAAKVTSLSGFVVEDGGNPSPEETVPLLVWVMRLIMEPRVIPLDGHLTGLLGLARVIVRWLGPRAKEAVGFESLEGLAAPRMRWSRESALSEREGGEEGEGGEGEGQGNTAAGGLLHYVYHECISMKPSQDTHGPRGAPKLRCGCACFFVRPCHPINSHSMLPALLLRDR